jgi:hypothetical protein
MIWKINIKSKLNKQNTKMKNKFKLYIKNICKKNNK